MRSRPRDLPRHNVGRLAQTTRSCDLATLAPERAGQLMSSAGDGAVRACTARISILAEPGSGRVGWEDVPIIGVTPMKVSLIPVAVFGGLGAVVPQPPTSGGRR
jgi:hypothetical protein